MRDLLEAADIILHTTRQYVTLQGSSDPGKPPCVPFGDEQQPARITP
jgi:hypothetical protein